MNKQLDKLTLEEIEYHTLLGDNEKATTMKNTHNKNKAKKRKNEMLTQRNKVFEGTLVAVGWDQLGDVNESSLYTQEDEDIILQHSRGMKKFRPFINQKVRVEGDIVANNRDGRKVMVKKICRLLNGFTNENVLEPQELDRQTVQEGWGWSI